MDEFWKILYKIDTGAAERQNWGLSHKANPLQRETWSIKLKAKPWRLFSKEFIIEAKAS